MNEMRRVVRSIVAVALACAPMAALQAQAPTGRVVRAANAFLATLDTAQRRRTQFDFGDDQQRVRWSNLPTSFVKRAGVNMGELNAAQRAAALALLASALSPHGFEKVQQIVQADEVLKSNERNNPMFGKDLYYFSILGTPSETAPWMLQFGGHHLALNITIIGAQGVLTPSLTGAQPGTYTENGRTIRPLGQENDKAFALLHALDASQSAKAVLNYRVGDLVLGPGRDGRTIQPEGLKATEMNAKQRAMLLDLISEWTAIVQASAAAARMAVVRADLDSTRFAWSGPTTVEPGHNGTSYYRIQGPHLVIEYAPQQMGGDPSNHIHTIYRDPTNDYGRKVASK